MSVSGTGLRAVAARAVAVPAEWSAATRRRAQAVLALSTAILLASVPTAAGVLLFMPDPHIHLAVILLGFPAYLLVRSRVQRGHVSAGAWLLIGYFLVVPVLGTIALGEMRASPFFAVLGVLIAGLLLPPWEVVVAGAVSLVVLVGVPLLVPPSARYAWADVRIYLVIVIGLATVAATAGAAAAAMGFNAADRSRRRSEQLADELRDANAQLEDRVGRRTAELAAALERERRLSDTLAELSVRDPLTGLYNRRHLEDELIRLTALAARLGSPLSLAIIDLDDFKQVNDRFTHVVGDDVLRVAADVLTADTRASDVLVRMGGEEFALLMPGTDTKGAVEVCERMRADLEGHDWSAIRPELQLTASFGVATSMEGKSSHDLLLLADTRLLEAKRQGKNRVVETSVV